MPPPKDMIIMTLTFEAYWGSKVRLVFSPCHSPFLMARWERKCSLTLSPVEGDGFQWFRGLSAPCADTKGPCICFYRPITTHDVFNCRSYSIGLTRIRWLSVPMSVTTFPAHLMPPTASLPDLADWSRKSRSWHWEVLQWKNLIFYILSYLWPSSQWLSFSHLYENFSFSFFSSSVRCLV